jgi:hypothetical protein
MAPNVNWKGLEEIGETRILDALRLALNGTSIVAEFNQVSRTLRPQKQTAIRACNSLAFWLAAMFGNRHRPFKSRKWHSSLFSQSP